MTPNANHYFEQSNSPMASSMLGDRHLQMISPSEQHQKKRILLSLQGNKLQKHLNSTIQKNTQGKDTMASSLSLRLAAAQHMDAGLPNFEKTLEQMQKQSMYLKLNDIPKRNKLEFTIQNTCSQDPNVENEMMRISKSILSGRKHNPAMMDSKKFNIL